jgi:hypothetical protein
MDIRPVLMAGAAELNASIIAALQTCDQSAINRYTAAFLNGEVQIPEGYLRDRRPLGKAMIVIACTDNATESYHTYYQGEKVCDYFLCLLEVKYRVSSRDILNAQGVRLAEPCDAPEKCLVCNSATYPIDDSLRDTLLKYWLEKQASQYSCSPPVWVQTHH